MYLILDSRPTSRLLYLRAALEPRGQLPERDSNIRLLYLATPLLQHQGVGSVSSGLPSLSGVGSVPGVACPVYASPSLLNPQACLYPNMQAPLPTAPLEEGKIDFKTREVCFT